MTPDWKPSERFDEWKGCFGCAHWRYQNCIAYPKAIPFMIVSGQTDHMVPRPGQVGDTVFEPMDVEHWRLTGERRPRGSAAVATAPEGVTE